MQRTVKRSWRVVTAMATLALVAAACGGNGDEPAGDEPAADGLEVEAMEIVTAPTGSAFFPLGSAIAAQLESELEIPVTAAPSAGSGENVVLIQGGEAELGIVASNALVPAFAGEPPQEEPHPDLRLIAHLYPNALVVYALEASGFEAVSDLEGHRVGVGLEARTWDHFISPLFESQGLVYGENMTPVYAGFEDMANQVRDGQLDAAIATGGADAPSPAFQSLAAEVDVRVLEWDQAGIESVAEALPYVNVFADYDGNLLEGYDGDTYFTADIGGPYLATTAQLSEELVYEITRLFHENLEGMAEDVAVLNWPATQGDDNLVQPLGDVPFHDGAIRYWREIGAMD